MDKRVRLSVLPRKGTEAELMLYVDRPIDAHDVSLDTNGVMTINNIGMVRINGPRILPKRFTHATLRYAGGRWSADLTVPAKQRPLPPTGKRVGVDVGVFYLISTSDGYNVRANEDLGRLGKLVDKQRAELETKDVGSTRYEELLRRIERNEQRMNDIHVDQANKIADYLTQRYDFIALEEVNVAGAGIQHNPTYKLASERRRWDILTRVLKLRCYETGRILIMVPPFWSSQECGRCGLFTPKPLDKRTHLCTHCGYSAPRDQNAANVILNRGIAIHQGSKRTDWHPKGHPNYRHQE